MRKEEYERRQIQRIRDLVERGYGSRSTIWRLIRKKKIPKPFDFLGRPAWLLETIEEFENSQAGGQS